MKHVLLAILLTVTSFTVSASYTGAGEKTRQCDIDAEVGSLVLMAHMTGRPKSEVIDVLTSDGEILSDSTVNLINGIYRGGFDNFTTEEFYDFLFKKCVEVNLL